MAERHSTEDHELIDSGPRMSQAPSPPDPDAPNIILMIIDSSSNAAAPSVGVLDMYSTNDLLLGSPEHELRSPSSPESLHVVDPRSDSNTTDGTSAEPNPISIAPASSPVLSLGSVWQNSGPVSMAVRFGSCITGSADSNGKLYVSTQKMHAAPGLRAIDDENLPAGATPVEYAAAESHSTLCQFYFPIEKCAGERAARELAALGELFSKVGGQVVQNARASSYDFGAIIV
jgi:hypothetical protein